MSDALLTDLARVKAIFQQRAILLHMGFNPAGIPTPADPARADTLSHGAGGRASSSHCGGTKSSINKERN